MKILSLDIATRVGYAIGQPPQDLRYLASGAYTLRAGHALKPRDRQFLDYSLLAENFEGLLIDLFTKDPMKWPDMVTYEAPMDVQWSGRGTQHRSSASLLLPIPLVCKLELFCWKRKIRIEKVDAKTVRKLFIGMGTVRSPEKDKAKKLVRDRCVEYGYVRPNHTQFDQTDAIALWHYSQVYYGRWQPPVEFLLGRAMPILKQS